MIRALLIFTLSLVLTACSLGQNETLLHLTLVASEDQNPDVNQRPSPMIIKLVEMTSASAFTNGDFFALYGATAETLGPDFIVSETLAVRPGETVELYLKLRPNSKYVGVVAAYRQLYGDNWRYVLPLVSGKLNTVELALTREQLVRISADKEK